MTLGMKAHIGVDADSGLVHTVVGTAANVSDVTQAHALVHGEETDVFADAGYQAWASAKRPKTSPSTGTWPCDRASARCWTRARRWARSWTVGAGQGPHPRQGRTPVPRDQAPVRACEGALSGTGHEHRATAYAVALSNLWMVRRTLLREMWG